MIKKFILVSTLLIGAVFVAQAQAPVPAPFFGFQLIDPTNFPTVPTGSLAKQSNAEWPQIEPNHPVGAGCPGTTNCTHTYIWTVLDQYVATANAHSIPIEFMYEYAPNWATGTQSCTTVGCGNTYPTTGVGCGGGGGSATECIGPVTDLVDMDAFITALTQRYNGTGHGSLNNFELANESFSGEGSYGGTFAQFAIEKNRLRTDILAANPSATVGCCGESFADATFTLNGSMDKLWQAGLTKTLGFVSFHAYPHHLDDSPEYLTGTCVTDNGGSNEHGPMGAVNCVQQGMARNGISSSIPIWMTEGSWGDTSYSNCLNNWGGGSSTTGCQNSTIALKEAFVSRYLLEMYSSGASLMSWYGWDVGGWGSLGTASIAWTTTRSWMLNSQFTGACAVQSVNTWSCGLILGTGSQALAVWNVAGANTFTPPPQYTQMQDITGAITSVSGSVAIGQIPILLITTNACGMPYPRARCDLNTITLPSVPPQVGPNACTAGFLTSCGNLTGAGTRYVDPNFGTSAIRITDNTFGKTGQLNQTLVAAGSGSGDEQRINCDSSKFIFDDSGGRTFPATLNFSSNPPSAKLYTSDAIWGPFNGFFFNITGLWGRKCPVDNNILYVLGNLQAGTAGNVGTKLGHWDLSNLATPPPSTATLDFDFQTCLNTSFGGTFNVTWTATGGSDQNDNDFGFGFNNSGGQAGPGALYVAVWRRGSGCRVLNLGTYTVTGDWGLTGAVTGSANCSGKIHNVKLYKIGASGAITITLNGGVGCSIGGYVWNYEGLSVTAQAPIESSGHFTNGLTHYANTPGNLAPFWAAVRPLSNLTSVTGVTPSLPAGGVQTGLDTHYGWNQLDDSLPFVGTSTIVGGASITRAWTNEILAFNPSGNANPWRLGSTFNTGMSANFSTQNAISAISQDGNYLIWSSDWMGTLGSTSGLATCSPTIDCRGDVFVVQLNVPSPVHSNIPLLYPNNQTHPLRQVNVYSGPVNSTQNDYSHLTGILTSTSKPYITGVTSTLPMGCNGNACVLSTGTYLDHGTTCPAYTFSGTYGIDALLGTVATANFLNNVILIGATVDNSATPAYLSSQTWANSLQFDCVNNDSALTWTAAAKYLPSSYILASGQYWQMQKTTCTNADTNDIRCVSGATIPACLAAGTTPCADNTASWTKLGTSAPVQDYWCDQYTEDTNSLFPCYRIILSGAASISSHKATVTTATQPSYLVGGIVAVVSASNTNFNCATATVTAITATTFSYTCAISLTNTTATTLTAGVVTGAHRVNATANPLLSSTYLSAQMPVPWEQPMRLAREKAAAAVISHWTTNGNPSIGYLRQGLTLGEDSSQNNITAWPCGTATTNCSAVATKMYESYEKEVYAAMKQAGCGTTVTCNGNLNATPAVTSANLIASTMGLENSFMGTDHAYSLDYSAVLGSAFPPAGNLYLGGDWALEFNAYNAASGNGLFPTTTLQTVSASTPGFCSVGTCSTGSCSTAGIAGALVADIACTNATFPSPNGYPGNLPLASQYLTNNMEIQFCDALLALDASYTSSHCAPQYSQSTYQTPYKNALVAFLTNNVTAGTPQFNPLAGSYTAPKTLTLTDATTGATICYTLDGSTPTGNNDGTCIQGTAYSGSFNLTTETVKAIATKIGNVDSAVGTAAYTIILPQPTASPIAGAYTSAQLVTLSDTVSSIICYTTDGSSPAGSNGSCTAGIAYTGAIGITQTTTIKALATVAGYTNSGTASFAYTITITAATPVFSPLGGTYTGPQNVIISDATSGSTICYTIDGSTPTADGAGTCVNGNTYSAAVAISTNITLKAIASKTGFSDSAVQSGVYLIQLPAPDFSPNGGTSTTNVTVTLSDNVGTATICYTTDGTTPTANGAGTCTHGSTYSTPFSLTASGAVRAVASLSGSTDSSVSTASFTILVAAPTYSPLPGTYTGAQTVALATATGSATICYTEDGSTPTTNGSGTCTHGSTYVGTIAVAATETIKAIASKSGDTDSAIVSGVYTIVIPTTVTPPTFNPVAGTYQTSQTVSLADTTSGSTICFTLDGTVPTADGAGTCINGSTYSSSFTVAVTTTVKAIGSKSGSTDSSISTAVYTIQAVAPLFSLGTGTYLGAQSVTLASTTAGAAICFTSDGTTPTATAGICTHGTTYAGAVSVTQNVTLMALATKAGLTNSSVTTVLYTIQLAPPSFSLPAGAYNPPQTLTLSGTGTICYTLDGSAPAATSAGTCSHGTTYAGAITLVNETVKALATRVGNVNSTTVSQAYTLTSKTPVIVPLAGTYTGTQSISVTDATVGAIICYTTDGSIPAPDGVGGCTTGTVYTVPFSVTQTTTVKTIAGIAGTTNSAIASSLFTIQIVPPTFAPGTGTYPTPQSIIIASTTPAATFCYTVDGTTPTGNGAGTCTHGSTYSTPVTVSVNETIKAIGTESGFADSSVSVANYIVTATAPIFTSVDSANFLKSVAGNFQISASGFPIPTFTKTGSLPSGLTLVDNGNGTASLSGTPTVAGQTVITVHATNSIGTVNQTLTINVFATNTQGTGSGSGSFTVNPH